MATGWLPAILPARPTLLGSPAPCFVLSGGVEGGGWGVWQKVQPPTPPPFAEKSCLLPAIPPPGAAHASTGTVVRTIVSRALRSVITIYLLMSLYGISLCIVTAYRADQLLSRIRARVEN